MVFKILFSREVGLIDVETNATSSEITDLDDDDLNSLFSPRAFPVRINHTVILDDPFDDPPGLTIPDSSPEPTKEQLDVSIADDLLGAGGEETGEEQKRTMQIDTEKRGPNKQRANVKTLPKCTWQFYSSPI